MTTSTDRARRFRLLANECRTTAEGMTDAEAREAMLRLAGDYDHLAAYVEEHTSEQPKRKNNQ